MLDLKLLCQELSDRKNDIFDYEQEVSSVSKDYIDKLHALDALDKSANQKLPRYSGCKVLEEGRLVRCFPERFLNRQQATDWAMNILKGNTIAAVDGSQIFPSRQISVPIGLAQAGLIVNHHSGKGSFSTSTKMSLIMPRDFEDIRGTYAYSQAPVSLRRYELECERIIEFMHSDPGSLVFFDGSLVLSFISQVDENERKKYAEAIVRLFKASDETRTPIVAYTDMSLSKDLVTMMQKYFRLKPTTHLADVYILRHILKWGDRTRAFLSDRDDKAGREQLSVLDLYGEYRDTIAFFYIQSSGGLPSKIEMPKWCFEEGMTDRIADVVRAECIIRPGYPDIIHRAHEYSKISQAESELFNNMLENFARDNNIKIYRSAKEFNKLL